MKTKSIALSIWIIMIASVVFSIITLAAPGDITSIIGFILNVALFILFIIYLVGVVKHHRNHYSYTLLRAGGILGIVLFVLQLIIFIAALALLASAADSGMTSGGDVGLAMLILLCSLAIFGIWIATFVVMIKAWLRIDSSNVNNMSPYGQQNPNTMAQGFVSPQQQQQGGQTDFSFMNAQQPQNQNLNNPNTNPQNPQNQDLNNPNNK